ncbi:hypothetical protein [Sphingosinicella rhizophila]|uniref:PRC-barrel domain-containing protein n=1 Tax=Sphingosinicella rhizophila TaxID=3050082 RepID=A0ABU3Q6Q6_9SPHN|nr:hypothetical protein [Sphingosinicella sp. GR2756]MDT9599088.1 hypothetical protein [Sphingosinicella sp. GR2756]
MTRAFKHLTMALCVLGAGAVSQPALAQATEPGPGAEVIGPSGGVVGTIASVDDTSFVVKTDKHEVRVPRTSFTPHEGKLLFGLTREQLNAEFEKALAGANANLVVGMVVHGSQGTAVGTIDTLDDQFVTLKLMSGKLIKLPRSGVAGGQNGAVIGMTAEQLEAAVQTSS